MYPTQIHLQSLISALNSRHRVPYIQAEATSTTIGLAAVGAYGRGIIVEETFWSQGMSPLGIETCGPEWHRLPSDDETGCKIGAGPFMALYCQASWLIVTPDMSDAALDALAEAAERWARREWGVEFYAAFQAGFEHCDTLNLGGVAVCTPTERQGLFEGKLASQMVDSVPAPPMPGVVAAPASVIRFADHYRRKAGVAC